MKPAIILPTWALQDLSPTELSAVVLHELAHLRRWDDWTNLAQSILGALFFFHPAIWWVGQGLSREREMACDDFVLASTSNPRAYAQCLVTVAEKSLLRRSLALAQAAVGRMQETAHRVARILDVQRPAATKVWKPAALGVVSVAAIVCIASLSRAPKLIAFDEMNPAFADSAHTDSAGTGAKLIPATFRERISIPAAKAQRSNAGALPSTSVTRTKAAQANYVPANHSPNVIQTVALSSHDRLDGQSVSDRLTNDRVINNRATAPRSVLLVMQTQQIDEDGRVWNIFMWHLTVFHPVVPETHKQIVPKTT